jgi:hypothetical protein
MALCMSCGAVMHNEDMATHVCKAENLPAKGKEKIPTTTEVSK